MWLGASAFQTWNQAEAHAPEQLHHGVSKPPCKMGWIRGKTMVWNGLQLTVDRQPARTSLELEQSDSPQSAGLTQKTTQR